MDSKKETSRPSREIPRDLILAVLSFLDLPDNLTLQCLSKQHKLFTEKKYGALMAFLKARQERYPDDSPYIMMLRYQNIITEEMELKFQGRQVHRAPDAGDKVYAVANDVFGLRFPRRTSEEERNHKNKCRQQYQIFSELHKVLAVPSGQHLQDELIESITCVKGLLRLKEKDQDSSDRVSMLVKYFLDKKYTFEYLLSKSAVNFGDLRNINQLSPSSNSPSLTADHDLVALGYFINGFPGDALTALRHVFLNPTNFPRIFTHYTPQKAFEEISASLPECISRADRTSIFSEMPVPARSSSVGFFGSLLSAQRSADEKPEHSESKTLPMSCVVS